MSYDLDPISIATSGYVCGDGPDSIAIATHGYVCPFIDVDIVWPSGGGSPEAGGPIRGERCTVTVRVTFRGRTWIQSIVCQERDIRVKIALLAARILNPVAVKIGEATSRIKSVFVRVKSKDVE